MRMLVVVIGGLMACSASAQLRAPTQIPQTAVPAVPENTKIKISGSAQMRTLTIKQMRSGISSVDFELSPKFTYNCTPTEIPSGASSWMMTCTTAIPDGTKLSIDAKRSTGGFGVGSALEAAKYNNGCDYFTGKTCVLTMNKNRTLFLEF